MKLDALYIPHGSDERATILPTRLRLRLLYIPHGSDERWEAEEEIAR